MFKKIKDFLTMDIGLPVWLYWTLCFFAGSGLSYWVIYGVGKISGMDIGYIPKNK